MERPPRDRQNARRGTRSALVFTTVALVFALVATATAAARPVSGAKALAAHPTNSYTAVCGAVQPLFAHCDADVVTQPATGAPFVSSAPSGYGPTDLLGAYALASAAAQNGSGETVGIVDAYDDPNAEADLGVYRSEYGLTACTTANGCFRKVNQTGGTSYPSGDTHWGTEISLDLDMVSAICPKCHILLVEATDNSFANLETAVDEAATLGATQISNSYGGGEFSGENTDQNYNHPGIAITASSGDGGYGVEFPAASQYVTAVGGTSLTTSSSARGWSETAWSGAGSGCSQNASKPSWQKDTGCSDRTVADLSAVADPSTGVAVYDTYGYSGWLVFGGTSVASPIIASYYALIGSAAGLNNGSWAYNHASMFNDVTSGSNGSCGGSYLCTAEVGYDGPTGIGTPEGIPVAPTVTTGASSGVGTTSATVAGTVNPNGQATTYHFDYGLTTSYGSQSPAAPDPSAGSGTTSQNESTTITGLTPGKMYHYRIEATNATGTTYGSDGTFTTTSAGLSLTVTPGTVSSGGSVSISWSGVSSPTPKDWLALYHPGDPNGSILGWIYDNSCTNTAGTTSLASGTCSFTMPVTAGTYEIRLFANDGYTLIATSNSVTVTNSTSVTVTPSSVAGGGSVSISWSGVGSPTSKDWLALYHPGDPNGSILGWIYDNSCTTTPGTTSLASGSCSFTMPATAGTYEIRLFANNGYTLLADSNPVTVTSSTTTTVTVTPGSVSAGGSVSVAWSGVSSPTSKDWLALYHPGDPNGSILGWIYDNSCTTTPGTTSLASGSCSFTMPATAGTYEIRLFANNGYTLLADSNPVTVTSSTTTTVTVTPGSVSAGGSVSVAWSGVSSPTSKDWLALYHPGDPNGSILGWIYDNSCTNTPGTTAQASGSCSYTMPATAGTYQFRLFANNGYTLLATSNSVTVS